MGMAKRAGWVQGKMGLAPRCSTSTHTDLEKNTKPKAEMRPP